MGLPPIAVAPEWQRQGVGSLLVREGLDMRRLGGCEVVVVVGYPGYYPRFGFVPASRKGLSCEYDRARRRLHGGGVEAGRVERCAGAGQASRGVRRRVKRGPAK